MALQVMCDQGHSYIQENTLDTLRHWPAPACPECRKLVLVWAEDAREGNIICPECGAGTFKVEFIGPSSGCAGGKLTLTCTQCHKSGVLYDDEA